MASEFAGIKVVVMGLGLFGGGAGAARFFAKEGARVTVTDIKRAEELGPSLGLLRGLPVKLHLGGHREEDFREAELVVANPAVRTDSPYLQAAREAGAKVKTEVSVFVELCAAKIVGITGSNGKSTTTALTGHLIAASGIKTWVGGNIGGSLLESLGEMSEDDVAVLELSSFQLPYLGEMERSPEVGVLTNLSPNHLDRHATMEEYAKAKSHIFRYQGAGDYAVLNRALGRLDWWEGLTRGKVLTFGLDGAGEDGTFMDGKRLCLRLEGRVERVATVDDVRLPGRHNLENALAAFCAASVAGADAGCFAGALGSFKPLEHRLEFVRRVGGVEYYNDSIATTPESAIAALRSFPGREIVLIAGGYDKGLSYSELAREMVKHAAGVITLGATAGKIEEAIREASPAGLLVVRREKDLAAAAKAAREISRPGGVVLLSPGCASFDMFRNFAQRGRIFKELVMGLAQQAENA